MTKPIRHPESGVYMTLEALSREGGISISAIRKALREHRIEGIKDSEGRWAHTHRCSTSTYMAHR
jgi:hypothetical protein